MIRLITTFLKSNSNNSNETASCFINCVLERGDYPNISPLEELLTYQLTLNVLIFISMILFLFIIFNKNILKYNLNFIRFLVKNLDKYMLANKSTRATDWINNKFNKGIDINNRFLFIMFILNSIVLIIILFLNFYISAELFGNIDKYVTVYNYIHGKNL